MPGVQMKKPIQYGVPSDEASERLRPSVLLTDDMEIKCSVLLPTCSACGAYAHQYGDFWECDNGHRCVTDGKW